MTPKRLTPALQGLGVSWRITTIVGYARAARIAMGSEGRSAPLMCAPARCALTQHRQEQATLDQDVRSDFPTYEDSYTRVADVWATSKWRTLHRMPSRREAGGEGRECHDPTWPRICEYRFACLEKTHGIRWTPRSPAAPIEQYSRIQGSGRTRATLEDAAPLKRGAEPRYNDAPQYDGVNLQMCHVIYGSEEPACYEEPSFPFYNVR